MDKQINYLIRAYTYIFPIQFCFSNSLWKLLFFSHSLSCRITELLTLVWIVKSFTNWKVLKFDISNFMSPKSSYNYLNASKCRSFCMILSFCYHLDRLTLTMTFCGSHYRPVVPSHKLKESLTATIFNLGITLEGSF